MHVAAAEPLEPRMPIPILPTHALRRVLLWSLAMTAYSGLAFWMDESGVPGYAHLLTGLEAVLSLAIGLLLAFRINRAFDRWWEGRTLWGALVNACRNLAVKANNAVPQSDRGSERLKELVASFPYALRDNLRKQPLQLPPSVKVDPQGAQHVCSWISNQVYGVFERWKREQKIGSSEFWVLDQEAKVLLEICGGCERIRNTPIAPSYRVLLNHLLAFFFLTLPWGLVNEFGIWTIPTVLLASYFVIAAESIADHVEQPFEYGGDGLDLDRMSLVIETTVREIFDTQTAAHQE